LARPKKSGGGLAEPTEKGPTLRVSSLGADPIKELKKAIWPAAVKRWNGAAVLIDDGPEADLLSALRRTQGHMAWLESNLVRGIRMDRFTLLLRFSRRGLQ